MKLWSSENESLVIVWGISIMALFLFASADPGDQRKRGLGEDGNNAKRISKRRSFTQSKKESPIQPSRSANESKDDAGFASLDQAFALLVNALYPKHENEKVEESSAGEGVGDEARSAYSSSSAWSTKGQINGEYRWQSVMLNKYAP